MSNIIEITDFNAPELDVYARISEIQLLNRAEPEKGIFIAESRRLLRERWILGASRFLFWWNINMLRARQKTDPSLWRHSGLYGRI